MLRFPCNKISHYTTALARCVTLDDDFEVALVEVSFPFTFIHFPYYEASVITDYKSGRQIDAPLPKRYYNSSRDLLFFMNRSLPAGFQMELDEAGYIIIKKNVKEMKEKCRFTDDEVVGITVTRHLALMLGFDEPALLAQGRGDHRVNLFVGLPEQMFYYCDLVELQMVGDTMAPLLRNVNSQIAKSVYGATCTISFIRPFYLPLVKRRFETVEILIKDGLGRNVSFSHGLSTCTLHFRRKSYV